MSEFSIVPGVRRAAEQGPALLVSVRSPEEAVRALAGGAQIIDVKEPLRGPLGRPAANTLDAVADDLAMSSDVPLSAAVGELRDFRAISPVALPERVSLCKMGLAGMRARGAWASEWVSARSAIDAASGRPCGWVAVAYADDESAESPPIDDVLAAAVDSDCEGLLIDTFQKRGAGLLDLLTLDQIAAFANDVQRHGLFLAVAGKLTIDQVRELRDSPCDVVGVRSAVCIGSERSRFLIRERVSLCRTALLRTCDDELATAVH